MRFVLIFLFCSAAVHAAEFFPAEKIHQLAAGPYWKRLLHFRKGFLWGERSEADGLGFYISPEGRDDAEAEMIADIEAFQDDKAQGIGELKQHPQCAFPERYRYLKSEFHFQFPDRDCPEFKDWKSRFHAESVSLVYAAAYFGNPSSMFGHSFLRIDSAARRSGKKNDLLDYGISFEAAIPPGTLIVSPIKGVLGLFPGMYSQMPYFLKTNTYGSMESRDLWEYQLNLSPDQLDRLLNHIWEMGTTHFNYYFFNRNCSYQLMTLFEEARPDWDLKYRFGISAIPVDTIRALIDQKDSIKSVHYRPSLTHILERRLEKMNAQEIERFHLAKNDISLVNENDTANTLDALMDWQKYQAIKQSINTEEAEKKIDQRLLVLRARLPDLGEPTEDFATQNIPVRPDLGHLSSKFSIFEESEFNLNSVGIEIRPGFHDLLDPDKGMLPDSALNIGRFRLSGLTDGSGTTRLDELLIAEVKSYRPLTRLFKNLSWSVAGGAQRPVDLLCSSCLVEYAQGEIGLTLGNPKLSVSFLATLHGEYSAVFNSFDNQNYRIGPGAKALGLYTFDDHFKLLASFEHTRFFPGPDIHFLSRSEFGASYSQNSVEIRLVSNSFNNNSQYVSQFETSLGFYF